MSTSNMGGLWLFISWLFFFFFQAGGYFRIVLPDLSFLKGFRADWIFLGTSSREEESVDLAATKVYTFPSKKRCCLITMASMLGVRASPKRETNADGRQLELIHM